MSSLLNQSSPSRGISPAAIESAIKHTAAEIAADVEMGLLLSVMRFSSHEQLVAVMQENKLSIVEAARCIALAEMIGTRRSEADSRERARLMIDDVSGPLGRMVTLAPQRAEVLS